MDLVFLLLRFDYGALRVGMKKMGDCEVLAVNFFFNGQFVLEGSKLQYCNGDLGLSHIEKDKVSIPELEAHLMDHTTFKRSVRMYWLPFGTAVHPGMRLLVDDKSCLEMVDVVESVGKVDIYTELIDVDWHGTDQTETQYGDDAVFDLFREDNTTALDVQGDAVGSQNEEKGSPLAIEGVQIKEKDKQNEEDEQEEESDSDVDCTGFTTDEDDEANDIRNKYKK